MVKSATYHKDIMDWDEFPKTDMVWTDPPWENRMVKFFQTMNRKQTGAVVEHNLDDILNQLARLSPVSKPVFIEYSTKGIEKVLEIMKRHGHKHNRITIARYAQDRPYAVLSFNCHIKIPEGLYGIGSIQYVLRELKPKSVFDPFAGIGVLCKAVRDMGIEYIGSEFNEARFNRLKEINK
jgi:hypothetical protein